MRRLRHELRLAVPGKLAELPWVTEELDAFWQAHAFDEETQADLNISIEEILSNAMRHGGMPNASISLRINVDAQAVRVVIEDTGRAFNPLDHPLPDPQAPIEERRGGGLGICMVRQMMDEISYERRGKRNCLRMTRLRTRKTEVAVIPATA